MLFFVTHDLKRKDLLFKIDQDHLIIETVNYPIFEIIN